LLDAAAYSCVPTHNTPRASQATEIDLRIIIYILLRGGLDRTVIPEDHMSKTTRKQSDLGRGRKTWKAVLVAEALTKAAAKIAELPEKRPMTDAAVYFAPPHPRSLIAIAT